MNQRDDNEEITETTSKLVEELASQIVECIQQCIEVLRSEFHRPTTTATTATTTTATAHDTNSRLHARNVSNVVVIPNLYTCIKERGIIDRISILQHQLLSQLLPQQHLILKDSIPLMPMALQQDGKENNKIKINNYNQERNQVVDKILHPLWWMLTICYDILDRLPPPKQQPPPQQQGMSRIAARTHRSVPRPPRGMLSIAHYTDIACLLEFTVCTSLLPHIEHNILLPAKIYPSTSWSSNDTRTRHEPETTTNTTNGNENNNNSSNTLALELARGRRLPKSLAGRLPRDALAWGIMTTRMQEEEEEDDEEEGHQRQQLHHPSATTETQTPSSSRELYETFYYMGKLLTLDRFRPMLLPRHLTDLYAAYLQSQHHVHHHVHHHQEQQQDQLQKDNTAKVLQDEKVDKQPEQRQLDHRLLMQLGLMVNHHRQHQQPQSSVATTTTTTTTMMTTTVLVDSYLQAQAYQQLLRFGHVATPKWMIQQVSSLLANLAGRDLGAVIDVFVPTSHGNTGTQVDTSAASQRLGQALAQSFRILMPLSYDSTSSLSSSSSSSSFSIGLEMARLLETGAYPTVSSKPNDSPTLTTTPKQLPFYQHSPRQVAILETLWAMLMQLPISTKQATATSARKDGTSLELLRDQLAPILVEGLWFPSSDSKPMVSSTLPAYEIHQALRRIGALFSYRSPSTKSSQKQLSQIFQWLVFAPFPNTSNNIEVSSSANNDDRSRQLAALPSTLLGQLLRLASMETTLHSTAKQEALQTLSWISNTLCAMTQFQVPVPSINSSNKENKDKDTSKNITLLKTDGCAVLTMALVHALAPCQFDFDGWRYSPGTNESNVSSASNITSTSPSSKQRSSPLELIYILQQQDTASLTTLDHLSAAITKRCHVLVDGLLLNHEGSAGGKSQTDGSTSETVTASSGLSCQLFQWCLGMYLSTLTGTLSSSNDTINQQQTNRFWIPGHEGVIKVPTTTAEMYRLVAMILLPILCEKCSPTDLLLGNDTGAATTSAGTEASSQPHSTNNVLEMVRLVLSSTATHFVQLRQSLDATGIETSSTEKPFSFRNDVESTKEPHHGRGGQEPTLDFQAKGYLPMVHANRILHQIFLQPRQQSESALAFDATYGNDSSDTSNRNEHLDDHSDTANDNEGDEKHRHEEDEDLLLSISSIVLSLLIAMLELGSSKRSQQDEEVINSFHSILKPLAEWTEPRSVKDKPTSWSEACAGMADMASYAMALIASRQATTPSKVTHSPNEGRERPADKWQNAIAEARDDLRSTQPPIRARGMVSLGRLARGHLLDASFAESAEVTPKLIVEITDDALPDMKEATVANQVVSSGILEILHLATAALLDPESYVYLAAVQTIVAVGDLRPREVFPVLGFAVASGMLKTNDEDKVTLLSEQRIKLAEALMFLIRRRAVTDEFVPLFVNMMVFGSPERIGNPSDLPAGGADPGSSNGRSLLIQRETDDYFTGKRNGGEGQPHPDDDAEDLTPAERREEQDIRLKTGGPVFVTEEMDLVRAARISVLVELVSASQPVTMAPYAPFLVRLCIDALRLDTSRPVSRVASLLARELYGSILREQEELVEAMNESNDAKIMIKHANHSLPFTVAMISSKVGHEDVLFTILKQQASFGAVMEDDMEKQRRYDPATSMRCQEAISWREQAEGGGIFAAARLLISNQKMLESNTRSSLLTVVGSSDAAPVKLDKWATIG